MYGYIKGTVTDVETSYIVLECYDIGYVIHVANPYSFTIDNTYKVYTYTHVREEEYALYGFKEKEEKDLFLKLLSVNGIGPKMALPMLATGSISGIIDAIDRENILYLKKFPKIGDKVARQIILDLKGKLVKTNNNIDNFNSELVEVLKGLGYRLPDIKRVLPSINYNNNIEDQIKEALKLMLK